MSAFTVTITGTASGVSTATRRHQCIAVETARGAGAGAGGAGGAGQLFLLDCGDGTAHELLRLGLPVAKLKALFVSHMHADHTGGIPQLVQDLDLSHNHPEYMPQVDELDVAMPPSGIELLHELLGATVRPFDEIRCGPRLQPLSAEWTYESAGVTWDCLETAHRPGENTSFAFRARCEGHTLVYSGDMRSVAELEPWLAEGGGGVDLLVMEGAHIFPLEESLALAAPHNVGRVVLSHISPNWDTRDDELAAASEKAMPGRVRVGHDGMKIEV